MNLTIEIDDELVADFYEAVGAYPDPAWTQEAADEWLRTEHLEPYVEKALAQAGNHVRRTRLTDAAAQEALVQEEQIRERLEERRRPRLS